MILAVIKWSHSSFEPPTTQDFAPMVPSSSPAVAAGLPRSPLTCGDDTLQSDNVGVVELAQDARFAEERTPLFVRAASP